MATVAEVGVNLVARTGQFERGMMRAGKSFGGLRKGLTALAAAAASRLVGRSMLQIVNDLDEVSKLAEKRGIKSSFLFNMRKEAEQAGTTVRELAKGIEEITTRVGEGSRGKGEGLDAFRGLGLDAKELAKLSPEEQFYEIADALNMLESNTRRMDFAKKLNLVELLPLISKGSQELRKMAESVDSVVGLSEYDEKAITKFKDNMSTFSSFMGGIAENVVATFADITNAAIDAVSKTEEAVKEMPGILSSGTIGEAGFEKAFAEAKAEQVRIDAAAKAAADKASAIRAKQIREEKADDEKFLRGLYNDVVASQSKSPTSIGMGQQISLRRTALHSATGISGGKPQMVKDPTLDVVVDVLRKILQKTGGATAS